MEKIEADWNDDFEKFSFYLFIYLFIFFQNTRTMT